MKVRLVNDEQTSVSDKFKAQCINAVACKERAGYKR